MAAQPRLQLARQRAADAMPRTRCRAPRWPRRAARRGADRPPSRRVAAGLADDDGDGRASAWCGAASVGARSTSTRRTPAEHHSRGAGGSADQGCTATRRKPRPGHPARLRRSLVTAGLLARGSSPAPAFPGQRPVAFGRGSPLTVAGTAADLGTKSRTAFPLRPSRCREGTVEADVTRRPGCAMSTRPNWVCRGGISLIVAASSVFGENRKRECGKDPSVRSRGCPRNCMRLAPPSATGAIREGGKALRSASQETCRRRPSMPKALGWRARGHRHSDHDNQQRSAQRPRRASCSSGSLRCSASSSSASSASPMWRPPTTPRTTIATRWRFPATDEGLSIMTVFRNVVFVAAIAGLAGRNRHGRHAELRHRAADPAGGDLRERRRAGSPIKPPPAMTMATPRRPSRRTTIARKPGPLPTVSSGSPIRWPPTW